jgi:hypothetical protein
MYFYLIFDVFLMQVAFGAMVRQQLHSGLGVDREVQWFAFSSGFKIPKHTLFHSPKKSEDWE